MKAIDTNVLVRFLVRDDTAQADIADMVIKGRCFISLTVFMECAWLLSSRYALSREEISVVLKEIIGLSSVSTIDDELVLWAITRFQSGADFADMLHLVDGRLADEFATFDRGIVKSAGKQPPMSIETLMA